MPGGGKKTQPSRVKNRLKPTAAWAEWTTQVMSWVNYRKGEEEEKKKEVSLGDGEITYYSRSSRRLYR